jgi:low temperature requirement protein LtrA
MRTPWHRRADQVPADRVTNVEVFFDIVFVFTLTQLAGVLEADLTPAPAGRILLLFSILWWMFDGYVWLANILPPRVTADKVLLFVAMAGFLVAAVGIPDAFGNTAILFALGYFTAICVHLLMSAQAGIGKALGALAAYNLTSAVLVLVGALVHETARYTLWTAALVIQMVVPYLIPRLSWLSRVGAFRIAPGHFIERHGLLVIIALGESVVAIGMGVDTKHVSAATVAVIVLALALPATLWWTYFTDAPATEEAFTEAESAPRARLALRTGFAHIALMLGVVVTAAGIHDAISHPGDPSSWAGAIALSGGVVVFLSGIIEIRHALHAVRVRSRVITALVVLAAAAIGAVASSGLQLAAIVVVMVVMLVIDRRYHAAQALRTATAR